ncbi:MAG: HAMP domain-containing sensor histidine kinase, partial [bacterium]|nr:HAMP domain-containing sensor histidine kinase [bacterium]
NYVYKAYFASKDISAERTAKIEHDLAQLERERVAILKAFSLQSEHQFRTPLSSIHTNLYLLRKVTDETKRARYLDVIEDQARLLLELVESLGLLTQIEIREELTEYMLNINEIIQGLLPNYIKEATAKEVIVRAMLTPDLPKFRGNHQFIKSSVQHLIRNAVAYTSKGGTVVITTRLGKTNKGQKAIELIVEDTGIGMSEKVQQHAFERFYRADVAQTTSGLGLGLPLVKEVAHHYGGHVSLVSIEGKGTVVTLTLPVM